MSKASRKKAAQRRQRNRKDRERQERRKKAEYLQLPQTSVVPSTPLRRFPRFGRVDVFIMLALLAYSDSARADAPQSNVTV